MIYQREGNDHGPKNREKYVLKVKKPNAKFD